MKKRIVLSLLIALVLTFGIPATTLKADAAYTYRVTVYAGNQGKFTQAYDGGTLSSDGKVWTKNYEPGKHIEISETNLGFELNKDSKYYARGFRVAGHDNDEIEEGAENKTAVAFKRIEYDVDADIDYELAYGLKGAMVAYTINYVDGSGKTLHASDTYYGMKGDKPVVSYRYVEGYYPNAYTQGKTLTANEKDNVFTFTYTPLPTPTTVVRQASTPGTTSNSAGSTGTSNAARTASRATTSSTTRSSTTSSTTGSTTGSSSSSSSNRTSSSSSNRASSSSQSSDTDSDTSTGSNRASNSDNTSTIDDDAVPLAQQPEQYIDIDEEPATLGEFVSEHKVPFIIGGIALLGAIGGLIAGLIVHSKNKKKREAEAEEEVPAQPAV